MKRTERVAGIRPLGSSGVCGSAAGLLLGVLAALPTMVWADTVISPGMGVDFEQVDYSFPGATGDGPSGTGQVDLNISQLGGSTGMSSGYVNITTASGWVTQNLPVFSGFAYPALSTTFNLGSVGGGVVTNLNALVTYTSAPLTSAPVGTLSSFGVGATEYNAEGQGAPVVAAPAPPPVNAVSFLGGLIQFVGQANHPNVQAANNQCGPVDTPH